MTHLFFSFIPFTAAGGRLEVANLGDSGVRVVRDGRVMFASAAQQHMFNMPFQLSHPSIIESPDDADSADVSVLAVKVSRVVVVRSNSESFPDAAPSSIAI